jgi:hypothetical protein
MACPQTETGVPACAYWTRADAVFLGKILNIEKVAGSEDLPTGSRKIRFQVLQNFKGADNPTFAVITKNAKTDCGLNAKKGETWIIYANNDIVIKSFAEFRGVKIEPKVESAELQTLKMVVAGTTSAAISGRIVWQSRNNIDLYEAGEEITVKGNGKKFSAQPDADGAFNIPVPSAGTYKVELKFSYNAPLKWNENLLGTSYTEGIPTLFKYEVRLNDGDCQFSFFEVLKK